MPLSDDGRDQAARLAAQFRDSGIQFDTVFSSDLCRALETCKIVVNGSDAGKEVVVDTRLRERGYGVVEGKSLPELRAAAKAAGFNEKNYSSFIPTGAESLDEVRSRIHDFCATRLVPQASPDQRVLVVTHGGVIREFMRFFRDQAKCQLPGLREPLRVTPNTGVSSFRIYYSTRSQSDASQPVQQVMSRAECLNVHDVSHLDTVPEYWYPAEDPSHNSQPAERPVQPALSAGEVVAPLEAL